MRHGVPLGTSWALNSFPRRFAFSIFPSQDLFSHSVLTIKINEPFSLEEELVLSQAKI